MHAETKKIILRDQNFNISIFEKGSPVWIIVTHGLGEHLKRHEYFAKMFSQYFNLCFYDLRGHGLSDGKKAYVSDFREFVWDLEALVQYLQKSYSMKRYILFGHSMGGLITASFIQSIASKNFYPEKVFLSAPPAATGGFLGDFFRYSPQKLTRTLCHLPFNLELKGLVDLNFLSHDHRIKEEYEKDPLNSLRLSTKLCFELINASRDVFSKPLRSECPLYAAVGGGDSIVNVRAFKDYFEKIEKGAQTLIVPDAYHEMHNEIEKYRTPYLEFLKKSMMESLFTNF